MDLVIERIGGRRPTEEEKNHEQTKNADYLFDGFVAELKILEEEPLEKKERQSRIATELRKKYDLPSCVDLDIKRMTDGAKADYLKLVGIPIKKAIKKAARQIDATQKHLNRTKDLGVLIAVNNGFSSLPDEEFGKLLKVYCRTETSQIDLILSVTVEYHQGDFDSYVFCSSEGYTVHTDEINPLRELFYEAVGDEFNERMTHMMRNQIELMQDPKSILEPVRDIQFDRDGVTFIRAAPKVPDSRFTQTERRG